MCEWRAFSLIIVLCLWRRQRFVLTRKIISPPVWSQTFTRFVQSGRIALVNYGPELNKLVVIVDLLDQNRVLVEGPSAGVKRQVISVKRLALTSILIEDLPRGAPTADVKEKYESADVDKKFAASSWGRKLDRKAKRANLDDFGRFKVMVARMKKSKAIAVEMEKLKA